MSICSDDLPEPHNRIELHDSLGVTARGVDLELVIGREVPEGLIDPRSAKTAPGAAVGERSSTWFGADGEKRHASLSSPFEPLPGWRFRIAVDQAGIKQLLAVRCLDGEVLLVAYASPQQHFDVERAKQLIASCSR